MNGTDLYLLTASELRSCTAVHTAAAVLIAVGLVAELAIKFFGTWLLRFRRFGNRLWMWLGVGGSSAWLAMFYLAQLHPELQQFFYWSFDTAQDRSGAGWLLPALMQLAGFAGCAAYLIACAEWLVSGGRTEQLDRSQDIPSQAPGLFALEQGLIATLMLLALPSVTILLFSIGRPLQFTDNVLLQQVWLFEKTLDALSFGLLDSFKWHLVNPQAEPHHFPPWIVWPYLLFVGLIATPLALGLWRRLSRQRPPPAPAP